MRKELTFCDICGTEFAKADGMIPTLKVHHPQKELATGKTLREQSGPIELCDGCYAKLQDFIWELLTILTKP